jgi:hypothetical protein
MDEYITELVYCYIDEYWDDMFAQKIMPLLERKANEVG